MSTVVRRAPALSARAAVRLVAVAAILAALAFPLLLAPPLVRAATAMTTSSLYLRAGPRTDQRIRLVMPRGASVEVIGGPRRGFYKVIYNGRPGWAHGDFLDMGGGTSGGGGGGSTTVLSSLNLRSGPSTSSGVLLVMPRGASVTLTGERSGDFVGVTYRGTTGWAHGGYLDSGGNGVSDDGGSPPGGSGGGSATVIDGSLNLRAGPSTADRVLAVMPDGATVELTGDEQNGFLGVIFRGTRGWAYGQYLDTSGGNDDGGGSGVDGSDGWSQDEIIAVIYAAADRWGQPRDDMLRVARCESGLNPRAVGAAPYYASGLFQFLRSTWATTPYANDDIFDPVASANAAGWMWSVGRRNEWVCQ